MEENGTEYSIVRSSGLRIAISGKSGCGNTTVSTLLSKALGVTLINFTFRQLAQEQGLTLAQVIENAKTDSSYDKMVDTRQVELAQKESCVLGSRLAIWMLKEADLKVYLIASDRTRAQRIFNREGGSIEDIEQFTAMRDREDSRRYKELYGIDNNDFSFADLRIDTSLYTPEQIVRIILQEAEARGLVKKKDVRWKQRFSNYKNALSTLNRWNVSIHQNGKKPSDIEEAALIKAFEFTYELSWKVMKDFLEHKGMVSKGMIIGSKDAVRYAVNANLIKDGFIWMDMIQSRNESSHIYDEIKMTALAERISAEYVPQFETFEATMEPHFNE